MAREILQRGLSISEISFKHSTILESKYKLMTSIGRHVLSFPATRAKMKKQTRAKFSSVEYFYFCFFLFGQNFRLRLLENYSRPNPRVLVESNTFAQDTEQKI